MFFNSCLETREKCFFTRVMLFRLPQFLISDPWDKGPSSCQKHSDIKELQYIQYVAQLCSVIVPNTLNRSDEMDILDVEREPLHPFIPTINNCTRGIFSETADNFNINDEDIDQVPLFSYLVEWPNNSSVHCHEFKPIFSNKNARRKLTVASVVCLFFVIAEVIGKCCYVVTTPRENDTFTQRRIILSWGFDVKISCNMHVWRYVHTGSGL
jgi:hypothetical protein